MQRSNQMGNCSLAQKADAIIDNQSQYDLVCYLSGFQTQLSNGNWQNIIQSKFEVDLDGVRMEGFNFNKKTYSAEKKHVQVVKISKNCFCQVGLNNISVGLFLTIFAVKMDEQDNQISKKQILKEICVRKQQDICFRINKDLTVKQLNLHQIQEMKQTFLKKGSKTISRNQQTNGILRLESKGQSQNFAHTANTAYVFKKNEEYLKNTFGTQYDERYVKIQETSFYELNHMNVKVNMKDFVQYDWRDLQALQLEGCGIDDKGWQYFCSKAQICFPTLKHIFLARNKITTISKKDLQKFPQLLIIELDYDKTQESNPLSEESKKNVFDFNLQHSQVRVYFATMDQKKFKSFNCVAQDQKPNKRNKD